MSLSGQIALWVVQATGFKKQSTGLHCPPITEPETLPFYSMCPFQNMLPTLPTMQLSHLVTSV